MSRERPSMFDLNLPCDTCGKNLASVYTCVACLNEATARVAIAEKERDELRARFDDLGKAHRRIVNHEISLANECDSLRGDRDRIMNLWAAAMKERDAALQALRTAWEALRSIENDDGHIPETIWELRHAALAAIDDVLKGRG